MLSSGICCSEYCIPTLPLRDSTLLIKTDSLPFTPLKRKCDHLFYAFQVELIYDLISEHLSVEIILWGRGDGDIVSSTAILLCSCALYFLFLASD